MIRALVLCVWVLAGPAAAQDAALSARVLDLLSQSERAAEAGDAEAARALLAEADALARRPEAAGTAAYWAPTVLQAERYADARDFDEAWRFAEAAATGLAQPPYAAMALGDLRARTALVQGRVSVETRDMVAAADYLAVALDGPLSEREALRARALRALALGFMGATETQAAFDALGPMRGRADELHGLLGDADYLLLIYQWIDLLRGYDPPPHVLIAFWGEEMIARLEAGAAADLGPYLEASYRTEAGLALAQAGRQGEAEPHLARAVEILTGRWPESRLAWRARYFQAYTYYTGGKPAEAAAALAAMVADDGPEADAEFLSYALQGQGIMAGPGPETQALFRRAYDVALRGYDRDSVTVRHAAGFIDPADPGFAGWVHAADIRPEIAADALDGQGTAILRAYLAGDHHVFDPILAEAEARLGPEAARVNAALAAALRGETDRAMDLLAGLRQGGGDGPGAVLDRIEILALLWGSQHRIAEAGPAIDRLARAEPDGLMAPVARAYKAMLDEEWAARDAALADWAARFDPGADPAPWAVMTALMVSEVGGAMGAVPEGKALVAQMQAFVGRSRGLSMAEDFVAFVPYLVPRSGARGDEGLDEVIALTSRLRQAFPPGTAIATTLPVTQARYEIQRGNGAEAERLYRDAIAAYGANRAARPEVLAMMRGELASYLAYAGRPAEALPLIEQAEQTLERETMPPGFRSAATSAVARVRLQLDGAEAARDTLSVLAEDERFTGRLRPIDRVWLFSEYAQFLALSEQPDEAMAMMDRAGRAMEASRIDDPSQRARLIYDRALVRYWIGETGIAFAEMTRSNDLYFATRAQIARESPGGVAPALPSDLSRALAEVSLGWSLVAD